MSLERDLRAEQVAYLDLSFYSLADGATPVSTVLERMRNTGHGCALITQDGRLAGIFTERDVLQKVVDRPETWDRPVAAVMTPRPDTVRPTAPVAAALRSMNRGHYRNVPVVDGDGKIIGN